MELISIVNSLLILLIVCLGAIFLPSYLREKGKNLATKEDIGNITEQVERVKVDYTAAIERLRSDLSRTAYVHRVQFDLEIQSYREVWQKAINLRRTTHGLRPLLDAAYAEGETEESRRKERLDRYSKALDEFIITVDENKPFYVQGVFEKLNALSRLTYGEAVDYGFQRSDDAEYWRRAGKNVEKINGLIDDICEAIRSRVSGLAVLEPADRT
jgi:Txe/YoeB family toxin of Txe-Axe toxin-antitoxin module